MNLHRTRPWTTAAGALYVLAWLTGLALAPAAPSPDAPAAEIHRFHVEHHTALLVQSWLVHGLAGAALAAIALAAATPLRGAIRITALTGGLGAAAVSLTQVALLLALDHQLPDGNAATTAAYTDAINYADSLKLLLLGLLVIAVTAGARPWPTWLRVTGWILGPLLPISGAAFPLHSPALYTALYVSLPLLLIWAAATALLAARRTVAG